jgi:hypothetical protein
MSRNLPLALAALLGLGAAINGLFMLVLPANWYFAVPGVTTTGSFNQHFVRDIGLIFLLVAIALLVGVARPAARVALWSSAALWLAGHALFHLWEVAAGICGTDALARDFPAITLPAILTTALAAWAWCDATRPAGDDRAAQ